MAAKRIILKKGNIYRIPISKDEVCFMQYLTDDRHQMGGVVIRVFWKRYKAADKPSVEEIVAGPVDFYSHVMIKRGIWLGYWEKYGHSDDLGDWSDVYFTTYMENRFNRISKQLEFVPYWRVWRVDSSEQEAWIEHDELPKRCIDAYEGGICPPSWVFKGIITGRRSNSTNGSEDRLRSPLGRKLKTALDAMCSSLGFLKTPYGVYYKEVGDGTIATFSFKCSPYKVKNFITAERRIRLTVAVGVVNRRIYDVYDKFSEYNHEEKCRKKFILPDETVITHIGRLMPQHEFVEWEVSKRTDLAGLCGELKESIIKYAYPFIDHLSEFENVAEAVRSGEYSLPMNNNILMSIISYLQGNKAKALESHQARYGEGFLCHESDYDEKFDKNFGELLTEIRI